VENFPIGDLPRLINCGRRIPAKTIIPNTRLRVKTPSEGIIAPNHEVATNTKTPTIGLKKDKPQIRMVKPITNKLFIASFSVAQYF